MFKKKSTPPTIHPKEKVKKTNPNKCLPKSQFVLLGDKNATDKKIFSTPAVK